MLVWEVEHVGSVVLALAIAVVAVSIGVIISRRLRANIDDLTDYYEGLLHIAGEQSRQAESANRLKVEFLATLSHHDGDRERQHDRADVFDFPHQHRGQHPHGGKRCDQSPELWRYALRHRQTLCKAAA